MEQPVFKFEIGDIVYHKAVPKNNISHPDMGVINSKAVEYFKDGFRIMYSVSVSGRTDMFFFETELSTKPSTL